MAKIGVFDATTQQNSIIEVDDAVIDEMRKPDLELEAKQATELAAKEAAQAKLAALGLTTDDLKALGL
jgi:hypothetical protein